MKKYLTILGLALSFGANAQQNATGTAQQTVQLDLSDAVEITFVNTGSATGNTATMNFTSANDYANGVESTDQELKVRSNKNFQVAVRLEYNSGSYVGSGNINTAVIPTDIFKLKVVSNSTGGNIASGFSSYSVVNDLAQDLILNGTNGDNQRFTVKYKCTPGFGMPEGTYTVPIIYTATQP